MVNHHYSIRIFLIKTMHHIGVCDADLIHVSRSSHNITPNVTLFNVKSSFNDDKFNSIIINKLHSIESWFVSCGCK